MSFKITPLFKSMLLVSGLSLLGSFSAVQAANVQSVSEQNVQQNRANPYILNAISIALNYLPGTKAMEVEEVPRFGKLIYVVDVTQENGEMIRALVDLETGYVNGIFHSFVPKEVEIVNREWLDKTNSGVYITLEDAITKAEQISGFHAVRADFDFDDGYDYYEIDLVDGFGNMAEFKINPLNSIIHDCDSDQSGPSSSPSTKGHPRSHQH